LSATSIDVKTGSPDLADFATTRHLIRRLWQFAQRLGRPLAYRGRHSAICQGTLPGMPQPVDFGRFYHDRSSNLLAYRAVTAALPTVASNIARIANTRQLISSRVIAKSAGSGDTVLISMGALLFIGLKQKFSFLYFCENFLKICFRFSRKKLTKSYENNKFSRKLLRKRKFSRKMTRKAKLP
jgi:hypothetical protein